ncbi:hypothetical protein B0H19DRAFT_1258681 [Mycena capillaripes]|nr:hypothetical protein B0H19DRAFT_1258681 [Mycena capillaripes]
MLAFNLLYLAATAPLLVPAAHVVGTDITTRQSVSTRYISTALEHFEPNTATLGKRTPIGDCGRVLWALLFPWQRHPRHRLLHGLLQKSLGRSGLLCAHRRDRRGLVALLRYQLSNGKCNTTALLTTIRGAIDAFLENYVNGQCSYVCLRMRHGEGAWTGYLFVGPATADAPPDCGTGDTYGSFTEHGDTDDLGARTDTEH